MTIWKSSNLGRRPTASRRTAKIESDEGLAGVDLGMQIGGKSARKIARVHSTSICFWKNAKAVTEKP
jgi:hypothetical protein